MKTMPMNDNMTSKQNENNADEQYHDIVFEAE